MTFEGEREREKMRLSQWEISFLYVFNLIWNPEFVKAKKTHKHKAPFNMLKTKSFHWPI